jgi:hypothetical protein
MTEPASWSLLCGLLPAVREEIVEGCTAADPVVGVDGEPVEDVGEVGERIDVVELAGLDDGVQDGRGRGALAAGEDVVVPADRDGAEATLGEVVVERQSWVVEEAGECDPVSAAVRDGLAGRGLRKERRRTVVEPRLEVGDDG